MSKNILIIGACGQIGTELTLGLRKLYPNRTIIASDIREGNKELMLSGTFEILNATDKDAIHTLILKHNIQEVYLLAAMLSATAEKLPSKAWNLNINALLNVLNLAKEGVLKKIFWPSSIAVFGSNSPKKNTPQFTITEPSTVYGISKLAGERWCEYYHNKYGVDVRSIRYPGIISWKTKPGGGTTDYAVEIYHEAIKKDTYDCFLKQDTRLPMMYMKDAVKATIQLMNAKKEVVKIRSSYNLSAINFTPKEIAFEIKKHLPNFSIKYTPDFRQAIADSWPQSIDDSHAKNDWGWQHDFNLENMTKEMLENLKNKFNSEPKMLNL